MEGYPGTHSFLPSSPVILSQRAGQCLLDQPPPCTHAHESPIGVGMKSVTENARREPSLLSGLWPAPCGFQCLYDVHRQGAQDAWISSSMYSFLHLFMQISLKVISLELRSSVFSIAAHLG